MANKNPFAHQKIIEQLSQRANQLDLYILRGVSILLNTILAPIYFDKLSRRISINFNGQLSIPIREKSGHEKTYNFTKIWDPALQHIFRIIELESINFSSSLDLIPIQEYVGGLSPYIKQLRLNLNLRNPPFLLNEFIAQFPNLKSIVYDSVNPLNLKDEILELFVNIKNVSEIVFEFKEKASFDSELVEKYENLLSEFPKIYLYIIHSIRSSLNYFRYFTEFILRNTQRFRGLKIRIYIEDGRFSDENIIKQNLVKLSPILTALFFKLKYKKNAPYLDNIEFPQLTYLHLISYGHSISEVLKNCSNLEILNLQYCKDPSLFPNGAKNDKDNLTDCFSKLNKLKCLWISVHPRRKDKHLVKHIQKLLPRKCKLHVNKKKI